VVTAGPRRLYGSFVEAPRKAGSIFRDYVLRLFYPLHELTWRDRWRCAPLLFLVELLVYQVDAILEGASDVDLDRVRNEDYVTLHRYKARFEALLRRARAHNGAVAYQLEMGEQYVRLENRVTSGRRAAHEDVLRLAELRPSDVRLMHAMIFARLGRPVDEGLLDLLWPVEVLADIGNDLAHYREDASTGQFNTYSAFVTLYGREAPVRMRAEIDRYERMFKTRLASIPPDRRGRVEELCVRWYRSRIAHLPEIITNSKPAGGWS
jgi:hypothetical protein